MARKSLPAPVRRCALAQRAMRCTSSLTLADLHGTVRGRPGGRSCQWLLLLCGSASAH